MASESCLQQVVNLSIAICVDRISYYNMYIVDEGSYTRRQTCVHWASPRAVMSRSAEIEFQAESGPTSGARPLQAGV